MAMKEPIFIYRTYQVVMPHDAGDYIPCMPLLGTKKPITRIPAGSILRFLKKTKDGMFEIEVINDREPQHGVISDCVFDCLLPFHQKKR